MAVNVLFKEILIADLPAEAIQEGKLMWVTDTYEIYFDIDATTRIRMYDGVMGSLADEYDPLLTYTLGSLVIYHGLLYKNTTAIVTPEAWDINHWTSVNLEDLMGKLGDLTTTTKTNIIAAINELDGDIGDLTTLTTIDKTSTVNAINELNTNLTQVDGVLTPISGYLFAGLEYAKQLNTVVTHGYFSPTSSMTAGTYYKIATVSFIPSLISFFPINTVDGQIGVGYISTSGDMMVRFNTLVGATVNCIFNFSYLV